MEINNAKNIFEKNGYIHIKNVIPKEMCYYFSQVLLRYAAIQKNSLGDEQVPNALSCIDHDIIFESLQEILWPEIEVLVGKNLLPTYSYARMYQNGNILHEHIDRDECEISVTMQLGRSHHYAWPIYMEGERIDLGEGDAVIYKGNKLKHWRNVCDGPHGYYSGQVFMHFVVEDGEHKTLFGDSKVRKIEPTHFVKNRSYLMEQK